MSEIKLYDLIDGRFVAKYNEILADVQHLISGHNPNALKAGGYRTIELANELCGEFTDAEKLLISALRISAKCQGMKSEDFLADLAKASEAVMKREAIKH